MCRHALLSYDSSADQWGVKLQGRWYRVGCGEQFALRMGDVYVGCRLELDAHWYVELPNAARFILHPRSVYTVSVDA